MFSRLKNAGVRANKTNSYTRSTFVTKNGTNAQFGNILASNQMNVEGFVYLFIKIAG